MCETHVSIQLMITRPLTMLHLSKSPSPCPQLIPEVRAVKDEAPTRNRIQPMVTGTRWAKMPNARWLPRSWKPTMRTTEMRQRQAVEYGRQVTTDTQMADLRRPLGAAL